MHWHLSPWNWEITSLLSAPNLPIYSFTGLRYKILFTVNFANLPNLRLYAPRAARSDRKFTNLPFYGAFLGNNGIYHFTVLPFYGVPWQKTCLRPTPSTQTPQFLWFYLSAFFNCKKCSLPFVLFQASLVPFQASWPTCKKQGRLMWGISINVDIPKWMVYNGKSY